MELPYLFAEYTRTMLGEAEWRSLSSALLEAPPPVSIRLNPLKGAASLASLLPREAEKVPWAAHGYYLPSRPAFTFDPLLHAGCYYVQEASSMFVEQALRQHMPPGPAAALDLCAAPGGKSTHLRSLLPESSLLVANEVNGSRVRVLCENLTKWGHPDVVVTQSSPACFASLGPVFDLVLTDVPCSGEGMFRKDKASVGEWSAEGVEMCQARQRRLLTDVWPCLKAGGLLVYSTCTFNVKENEENIRWLCRRTGAEVLPLDVPSAWGVSGNLLPGSGFPVCRFFPHKTRGEGFFMAVVRKACNEPDEEADGTPPAQTLRTDTGRRRGRNGQGGGQARQTPPSGKHPAATALSWLLDAEGYALLPDGPLPTAFPAAWLPLLEALGRHVRVVQAGIRPAAAKGKDCIPTHALAMSRLLRRDAFPCIEADYPTAVAYLRKEAVTLPDAVPRGFILLTYRGFPLGFVKNIGTRANNLYPQEWCIRSGHLPATACSCIFRPSPCGTGSPAEAG